MALVATLTALAAPGEVGAVHKKGQAPRPNKIRRQSTSGPHMQALGLVGHFVQNYTPPPEEMSKIQNVTGVLLDSVDPNGAAGQRGLEQGDVITMFNDLPVNGQNDLEYQIDRARNNDLYVDDAGTTRFVKFLVADARNGGSDTYFVPVGAASPQLRRKK